MILCITVQSQLPIFTSGRPNKKYKSVFWCPVDCRRILKCSTTCVGPLESVLSSSFPSAPFSEPVPNPSFEKGKKSAVEEICFFFKFRSARENPTKLEMISCLSLCFLHPTIFPHWCTVKVMIQPLAKPMEAFPRAWEYDRSISKWKYKNGLKANFVKGKQWKSIWHLDQEIQLLGFTLISKSLGTNLAGHCASSAPGCNIQEGNTDIRFRSVCMHPRISLLPPASNLHMLCTFFWR